MLVTLSDDDNVLSHRILIVAPIQVEYLLDNVWVDRERSSNSFTLLSRVWQTLVKSRRFLQMSMSSESFKKAVRWVFLRAMTTYDKRRRPLYLPQFKFLIINDNRGKIRDGLSNWYEYWKKRINTRLTWKGILQC